MPQEPMYEYRRFSVAERDRRWREVRQRMERDGIDIIIAPQNTGHSTDWQADARYLSGCGGGPDTDIACVFPLADEPIVVATSAVRWGPRVQEWMRDVREASRYYGATIADRLQELNANGKTIGICGLSGGTRTPEGSILHGTYQAIVDAAPQAKLVNATELLQEVRCLKSQEEIDVLQESVDVVERGVEAEVAAAAQPGVRDFEVWAATMGGMLKAGSELSMHFNWIADDPPTRTLTRPTLKVLLDGDIIDNELEASIIGYRAQQKRPVAVRTCAPSYFELAKVHGELYSRLLESIKPGVTLREVAEETRRLGEALCPKSGPLAGGGARLTLHGRGLGDDFPIYTSGSSGAERFGDWRFPENGVFIIKPGVHGGDRGAAHFTWGDTCRTTPTGAVRMGKAPHEMIVAR